MNLSNTIERAAKYFPEKEALIFSDTTFCYGELDAWINRGANYLKELGISRGTKVALYLPNCPEWIVFYYSIIRLGGAAVCLSHYYKQKELETLLNDSHASLLITCEAFLPMVPPQNKIPFVKEVIVIERHDILSSDFAKNHKDHASLKPVECDADDVCAILYTGGTTGKPKGAMLTHNNLLYTAQNVCYHEKSVPQDKGLCFMPLNHVFAGNHIMNALFYACATIVLHEAFDLDRILSSIKDNGITRFYAVPTIYIRLLNNPDSKKYLSTLTYCFSAATSMPSEIVKQWKADQGLDIHEAYGMTESSSLVTYNHMYRHKIGSVGTPAGTVEVKLMDQKGQEASPGQDGEIIIRGPNIMKGYLNSPEETEAALQKGWLKSGDIGRFDDEGYLFIVDRKKDLIISGGLNIYPNEVEEILYTHDAVEECAVVGRSHPEYGEAVTAFVLLKEGRIVEAKEIIGFCKERIASYKAPKEIIFVEDFPKTPQGKILKMELRSS